MGYKTFDNTLFILNKGGHYYPLKLKKSVNKKPSFLLQFKNNNASLGWQNSTTFSYRDEDYEIYSTEPTPAAAAEPVAAGVIPTRNALGGESKRGSTEPTNTG